MQHRVQKNNKDYRLFCIWLYARKEDLPFLENMKKSLSGIGNITARGKTCRYRITKLKDIENFEEHVGPLLEGRKAKEFKQFCDFIHCYKHRSW